LSSVFYLLLLLFFAFALLYFIRMFPQEIAIYTSCRVLEIDITYAYSKEFES